MRLSEDDLKALILSPVREIRERVVNYFAKPNSIDPSIMPLLIQAVERYGRKEAIFLAGRVASLRQTAATVGWIVAELSNPESETVPIYYLHLLEALGDFDGELLAPHEVELEAHRPGMRELIQRKLESQSWEESTCWTRFEEFCESVKSRDFLNGDERRTADLIVKSLARFGESVTDRVRSILKPKIKVYQGNPLPWMQQLAVQLVGEARLESLLPELFDKLNTDETENISEKCALALVQIGTPTMLEAVARAFPDASTNFRENATAPLESVHLPIAVEKCFELLQRERQSPRQDKNIQCGLAYSLLSQFAPEGVDPARKLVCGEKLNFLETALRDHLVQTCEITGDRFPEFDAWREARRVRQEKHAHKVEQLVANPLEMLDQAVKKLAAAGPERALRLAMPSLPNPAENGPVASIERKASVGRNDSCPCGSGKKFKNCCLNKNG